MWCIFIIKKFKFFKQETIIFLINIKMLKNIKSLYFIKIFFSYVDEEQKLRLIKYNKSLQDNININIISYKCFKGKYIIYQSKRYGKEYNGYNGNLIYEGEYLNGVRHGKGKEYKWNEILIYEGEYLYGKRNGKGKEYNYDGILYFEGEYLNGERNGKGKEFRNGKVIFEGEYINGIKWKGKGKKYYKYDIFEYEGE